MKKLIFILLFLSSFWLFAAEERLAIMEFEDDSGKIPQQMLKNAEKSLRTALARKSKGVYAIISPADQKAAINKMRKESHGLDRDESYRIALGKALSAAKIIYTTILFIDKNSYKINCDLINIETEQLETGASEYFDGTGASLDKAVNEVVTKLLTEEPVRPKKSDGQIACEAARAAGSEQKWKGFLKYYADEYPECVPEAKKQLEEIAYHTAERENSIESWTEYLDEYPLANKSHAIEAEEQIEKLKKAASKKKKSRKNYDDDEELSSDSAETTAAKPIETDGTFWSPLSDKKLSFKEADAYCSNLNIGGHNDWRLPTVDELRILVQNCPNLETDGACRLSEDNSCLLARKCLDKKKCQCSTSGKYSKLYDSTTIWSASVNSSDSTEAYSIDFAGGKIQKNYTGARNNVRCTR